MANCGADHGKICAEVDSARNEIKEVWQVLRGKLAIRVFAWTCSAVGLVLAFIIGWTQANNGALNALQQQQAVALQRIDHNKEIVTEQYMSLKESMKDLKKAIRESD